MSGPNLTPIVLAGQTYMARPFDYARDFREIEQYLVDSRQSPVAAAAAVRETLARYPDPELKKELYDRLYADIRRSDEDRRSAALKDVAVWLDTVPGFAFTIWQVIRDQHPELQGTEHDPYQGQATVLKLLWQTAAEEGKKAALARLKRERDSAVANKGGQPSTDSAGPSAPESASSSPA